MLYYIIEEKKNSKQFIGCVARLEDLISSVEKYLINLGINLITIHITKNDKSKNKFNLGSGHYLFVKDINCLEYINRQEHINVGYFYNTKSFEDTIESVFKIYPFSEFTLQDNHVLLENDENQVQFIQKIDSQEKIIEYIETEAKILFKHIECSYDSFTNNKEYEPGYYLCYHNNYITLVKRDLTKNKGYFYSRVHIIDNILKSYEIVVYHNIINFNLKIFSEQYNHQLNIVYGSDVEYFPYVINHLFKVNKSRNPLILQNDDTIDKSYIKILMTSKDSLVINCNYDLIKWQEIITDLSINKLKLKKMVILASDKIPLWIHTKKLNYDNVFIIKPEILYLENEIKTELLKYVNEQDYHLIKELTVNMNYGILLKNNDFELFTW